MSDTEILHRDDGQLAEMNHVVGQPRLSPSSLRRLFRLASKVEGATAVAQVAVTAHQTVRQEYEQMFRDMCEDHGIQIPAGLHDVDIDWSTGAVMFVPKVDA